MRNILFIFLLLLSLSASALDLGEADKAYESGDYELAVALYSETMVSEGVSAGLLYNLGNSYFQMGKDADAMVCYERARKLDPGNEMINQNLDFLRNKVLDLNKASIGDKGGNVEPDAEGISDRIYRIIAIDHQSNGWAVFAVMAFILFVGAMALYTFTPNILARKTGFFSGLVFLGFTVVFIIFAFMASGAAQRQDEAVLMSVTTELRELPEESSGSASSPLHPGTKLRILDEKKGPDGTEWLQVRLNSDNSGWIKKQDIEII